MLRGAIVLAGGAGFGLAGNLISSHYMSPEAYGTLTASLSAVSILAVLASLGLPWYFLANQEIYFPSRRKYLFVILFAAICASLPCFLALPGINALACSALIVTTALSLQCVLDAQVHRQHIWAAVMQSLPAVGKGGAAACLMMLVLSDAYGGDVVETYYVLLFAFSLIGAAFVVFAFFLRPRVSIVEGYPHSAARVSTRSASAYLGSAVLSLSYNMALPPIVAFFFGSTVAAVLGIYQIFWSINSLFLTAFVNNKIAPLLLSERNPDAAAAIWSRALKYSLYIGVASAIVAVVGGGVGATFLWKSYEGLAHAIAIGGGALFVRSFSAAYGVQISDSLSIRKKMLYQIFVFVLMLVLVTVVSASKVRLSSSALMGMVLLLECVLFIGYWVVAKGKSTF